MWRSEQNGGGELGRRGWERELVINRKTKAPGDGAVGP